MCGRFRLAAERRFFLGVPTMGLARSDVGTFFGQAFTPSRYRLTVNSLAPGTWDIVVFVHSSVSNTFQTAQVVRVTR